MLCNQRVNGLSWRVCGLTYVIAGQWLGHLWFLGNMLFYFFLLYPVCRYIEKMRDLSQREMLMLFVVATPFFALMGVYFSDFFYDGVFLFISSKKLAYYFAYFLLGVMCCRHHAVFLSMLNTRCFVVSLLASLMLLLVLLWFQPALPENLYFAAYTMIKGGWTLAMLSLLFVVGDQVKERARALSDASYTIYLIHQPLIVVLYVAIFEHLTWGAEIESLLLIAMVFAASYYCHTLLVQKSAMLTLLFNGVWPRSQTRKAQVLAQGS